MATVPVSGGACVVCPEGVTLIWSTRLKTASHRSTNAHIHAPQYSAYLWCNVVRSATEGARAHSVYHVLFTHAKVGDLDVSLRVQHHIVQLQIPKEARGHLKQRRGWSFGSKTAERLTGGDTS